MENFFREIALHNEAWDVEHNVPCVRHFTHDELAPAIQGLREAAELLKADSFRAIRQVNAEREPQESRTEEDKREDDMDRQRAYPERRP